MAPPPAADNFAQRQPITTAIHQICLYYPPSTCLRELLQNADDAGASEIEYVLDTKSYAGQPLLSDGLKDFQGPALLVRNNSVFRDEDFKSLSSVSDSVKRKDPAATGKFGQGFNAVYHWTDGPWVWSRNWLLILDPHEWWSQDTGQAGGPRWDVVQNRDYVEIQNHMKTFSKLSLDPCEPLNETVIRIPLRSEAQAAKSRIFSLRVDVSAIRQALEEFGQELKEGGMLFLKHIRKVIIRIDDDVLLMAEISGTNEEDTQARKQLPANFKSLYVSKSAVAEGICPVFELAMKYTEQGMSESRRYAVQHVMLSSSGDVEMDVWARNEKLFPWAAVAAPLKDHNDAEGVHGRLFTILRLPMPTNLPVHIHGLFCMAPDRGRLEPTRGPDDPHTKWNRFMFARCVALAWIKLLAHRNTVSWNNEVFAFWPRPNFVPVETVQLWDQLDDNIIDLAIDPNREVWNASNGRCVSLDQGFFAIKGGDYTDYGVVLAQVDVPVVYLEEPLFRKLRQRAKLLTRDFKHLEPSTVRCFLSRNSLPILSEDQASMVLEFCLLDAIKSELEEGSRSAIYNDLQDIPLWPTVTGALSYSNNSGLLLPRNEVELQLFAKSRAATTVDLSKLSSPVRQLLLKDIKNLTTVMRSRSLDDLAVDWPVLYPTLPGLSPDSRHRPSHLEAVLGNVWTWIVERFREGQRMASALSIGLWLVPLNDGRIRSYTPGPESLPVLIIVQKDPLYDFVTSATAKMPAEAPPLLCTSILPADAVELFRSNRELRVATNSTCLDDTNAFVDWLVAGRNMLSVASDGDKELLLRHLETITRDSALGGELSPTLISLLRRLPLYSSRSCKPPFKEISYTKCSLDACEHIYEAPPSLPPLPDMSNLSLFDPQGQAEISIVRRLKALPDVSNKDLLTRHFLPWMRTVTSCDAALSSAKEELVDWIMKIAPTTPRSAAWQSDVFGYDIIPLPIESGQRRYRCIAGMVDPSSDLAPLSGAGEGVFPCPQSFTKHKDVLIAYGLVSEAKWDTPLERARYFAQHGDEIGINTKIESLLKLRVLPKLSDTVASVMEIRRLQWLPAISVTGESVLLAPTECRGADDCHLIDLVLGITPLSMEPSWKKVLGWNEAIPTELLLRQLDGCLSKLDYEKAHKVLLAIDPAKCSDLLSRRCILGRSGAHFTPENVFLSGSSLARRPLAPFLDEVDGTFARQQGALLTALDVRSEPSLQDLQDVQRALGSASKRQLNPAYLRIAISTLEIATYLAYDLTGLQVPDTTSTLRDLADIVHSNSPNADASGDLNFTHPGISADLADSLGLEDSLAHAIRLQIDLDSDNEEEYVPGEKLTTVITDTLGRYSIASTFNEFLANADDAKAKRIIWTLDECKSGAHASTALLTTDLKPLQGAALFVHNDGVFSKKDFAGFKDIGQGGKHCDTRSTGMFGRGSQSMYHFTDVPMLVSARSLLVIDPQKMVLPIDKYRKRKVGTKLSFPTVRTLAFDQMSPFNGLHGFDSSTEYYKGTIFRFPLRAPGFKTDLKSTKEQVDLAQVRSLLEDYFATARTALLFLRHVESIEFRIRGQQAPQWAVSAKRSLCKDNDTFRSIEITSGQIGSRQQLDTWCVGLNDIKDIPADITRSGSSSGKSPECGVAACLIQGKVAKIKNAEDISLPPRPRDIAITVARQSVVRQIVFCRLPTSHESSLPISFHASFAVTGDRRTIALENSAENSSWNQWLLKDCVSALYVETLRYLAPRLGNKAFEFWPTGGSFLSSSKMSSVLERAFWDKLADQGHELGENLPLVAQKTVPRWKDSAAVFEVTQETTNLMGATFDFLPKQTSEGLRILLVRLIPLLVRPPKDLWLKFESISGHQARKVGLDCLSNIFKVEDNCKLLEAILANLKDEEGKRTAMALLLEILVPETAVADTTALSTLSGCRIIPRPSFDHSLGTLIWNPQPDAIWNLLPTSGEQDLFGFATDIMVNNELPWKVAKVPALEGQTVCNPIDSLQNANFNIRQLEIGDLGALLALPKSPINSPVPNDELAPWLLKFWQYLNLKSRTTFESEEYWGTVFGITVGDFLSRANLQNQRIFRTFSDSKWRYITPQQFESEPCVVRPSHKEHQKICDQIHGLIAIDRGCIPFRLREDEDSFQTYASFKRFLKALEKLEKATIASVKTIIGDGLTPGSKDVMRDLALNYLSSVDYTHQTPIDAILRRSPIWRRRERSVASPYEHIAAEDAILCGHEEMVMPWISNLSSFVEPHLIQSDGGKLRKLGLSPLSREQVWHLIKGDLPSYVKTKDSRQRYLEFLQYLARWENFEQWQVKITGSVAPNGNCLMCETHTLYDHQDQMFSAAFREERRTRFLHIDMQGRELRSFWLSLGLRVRSAAGVMTHEQFLECGRAIQGRWDNGSTTPILHDDSEVLSAYLGHNGPQSTTFESWPNRAWTQITAIPMFRVRDVPADERTYRQDQMHQIAGEKTHRALSDASKLDFVRILWSQACFLKDPPCEFVYKHLPRGGKPTVAQVFEHLTFLMAVMIDISQEDISEYLRDVQACYVYLEEDLDVTKSIDGIFQAPIWLNLDTTQVDLVLKDYLEPNVTGADYLCLNTLIDPTPLKRAKNFLVPYEKLLVGLGCQTVVQPTSAASPPLSDSREFSLASTMAQMRILRDQDLLVDVTLEAGGQRKPAHKIVLAAVSDFCRAQFAGPWGRLLEHQATIRLEELSFLSLSRMVDFAYTGAVEWPELKDPSDKQEVDDHLTELLDLLEATDMWLLTRLHDMTENFLICQPYSRIYIRVDTVYEVMERAGNARAPRLVKYCEDFLASPTNRNLASRLRDGKQSAERAD